MGAADSVATGGSVISPCCEELAAGQLEPVKNIHTSSRKFTESHWAHSHRVMKPSYLMSDLLLQ